jgi:hypothetical protein
VTRTRPYRNERIVTVIREMYFTGGATSFARKYLYLFPTHETPVGHTKFEVPVPMLALVATAVRLFFFGAHEGSHEVLAVRDTL